MDIYSIHLGPLSLLLPGLRGLIRTTGPLGNVFFPLAKNPQALREVEQVK
jgi:hypothetical protein